MIKIFGFSLVLFTKSIETGNMCSEKIKDCNTADNIVKKKFHNITENKSIHDTLPGIDTDGSITDSISYLIDMSTLDDGEDDYSTMEIDFKEFEKDLRNKRLLKITLIALIFIFSIGFITYSVISDLKTQKGKA